MSIYFESRLAADWPPETWRDWTVLVGVSGGADSTALLRGLAATAGVGAGRLIVAHFNHQLRGEASDGDEQFVRELANQLGLACEVGKSVPSLTSDSIRECPDLRLSEASTRAARYDFLCNLAEQVGARYVAVAHTADDQVETILHRILRGTGLAGLAGMRRARPLSPAVALIRPLLTFTRAELRDYLAELGHPFREDATNTNTRYMRNRLRQELLPLLADHYNSNVGEALLRLGQLASEAQAAIDGLTETLIRQCVTSRTDTVEIDANSLVNQPNYLVRELLVRIWRAQGWPEQPMGFREWSELAEFIQGAAGSTQRDFPGSIRAQKAGERVVLVRRASYD